jgi:N-acylmannosamine kinase
MSAMVALDIGGSKLAAARFERGRLADRREMSTPASDPTALVDAAAALLRDWPCAGLAVATTGYVADGKVYSVNRAMISKWEGFPLERALRERLNHAGPMLLLNDAAAAAWAEFTARSPRPRRMAFVTVSTGVGGGLVTDGALLRSEGGLAGHVGHMQIAESGACGCGRVGCVEAIASGTAIAAAAEEALGERLNAADVFRRAEADPRAAAILDRSAWAIATLAANLRMLLDIDLVVIGGGVGLAEGYLERVEDQVKRLPLLARTSVERALLGADAGLMGAALQLAEAFPECA